MRYPELRKKLLEIELPKGHITLSNNDIVTDVKKMIKSHMDVIDANPGNMIYFPYYARLVDLYQILTR